jgi:hypothetical protein
VSGFRQARRHERHALVLLHDGRGFSRVAG